jgi:inner membrane protein YidH
MGESNKKGPAFRFENELLANERTFLAWLRTGIAVMSLGFVVARFGLWLRELALQINPHVALRHTGLSLPLGEVMIGFGALMTLVAAWRYHVVNRAIERGEIKSDPRMVSLVTIAVVISAIALIIYMTLSQANP